MTTDKRLPWFRPVVAGGACGVLTVPRAAVWPAVAKGGASRADGVLISPAELTAALWEHWRIGAADVRSGLAGSGGYHWSVPDSSGRTWFVTASDLQNMPWLVADPDPDATFRQLRAAMDTSAELAGLGLQFVVAPIGDPWAGGPLGEQARDALARHAELVRHAWLAFDERMDRVLAEQRPLVLTHGEPHPANIIRAGQRRWLIDWDTVAMAWPERDLWMITRPDGPEAARYQAITGRAVSGAAIDMYRLHWLLDDLAGYTRQLRAEHDRTPDTEHAMASVTSTIDELMALV